MIRMRKILIATRNHRKFEEIRKILNLRAEFINLEDLGGKNLEVEETGKDYLTNAMMKAKFYAEKFSIPTIADDSGFEILSLGSLPGVMSARFLEGFDYTRKMKWILKIMRNLDDRRARFICCAVFYDPLENILVGSIGSIEGTVAREIRGNRGFGYDPIFIPQGYERTFGELPEDVKNTISHRARAFRKLQKLLYGLSFEHA